MMWKFFQMVKRWWVLALVFTLALSLTSCSKKKSDLMAADYGFGYCDGTLGSFDVYVIPNTNGLYELSIIPVSVNSGDIVKVHLVSSSRSYKEMVSQVVLQNDLEIFAGTVTPTEVQSYEAIAITPWDPSQGDQNVLDQQFEQDAICEFPIPPAETGNGLGGGNFSVKKK